jgi:solute:Na+ symporter, SSS family
MIDLNHMLGCLAASGLVLAVGCAAPGATGYRRDQLVRLLEQEMLSNRGWVRVHAAEALLDHGHSQAVAESFLPEADTAALPYRIGVWRVLARAAGTEGARRDFSGRIRRSMIDPQSSDRLHAAESLGKLGQADPADRSVLEQWLLTTDDATKTYVLWVLALSSEGPQRAEDERRLANLLESSDPMTRLRTAFALGRLPTISTNSTRDLARRLAIEPAASPARLYLLVAALLHADKNSAAALNLKRQLTIYLHHGKPNEQLEAAVALGRRGTQDDVPALAQLLRSQEPDARIGAANGLLYLRP